MDFGLGTDLIFCIIAGFAFAWLVGAIAAAVSIMINLVAGRRNTRNI